MMHTGDRIREVRRERDISVADLSRAVGIARSTLYDIERGDIREPSKLHRFALALRVSPEWLDSGRGPKFMGDQDTTTKDPNEYVTKVYGAKASAGDGNITFEHEEIDGSHAFKRSWLQSKGIKDVERCRMVEVTGFSMSPYLEDGDIVLVSLDETNIKSGQVYVIAVDDELLVKRLHKTADGALEIRSDNPNKERYPTERAEGERMNLIRILGRVVWRGG